MEIRILRRQGKSIRSIAKELSISRETVRKYLRSPGLEPVYGPRAPRPSKLDPYKAYIRQRWGTAARQRSPRGERPRRRAILVVAPVSSMKTSLAGSRSGCASNQASRRELTSSRSC